MNQGIQSIGRDKDYAADPDDFDPPVGNPCPEGLLAYRAVQIIDRLRDPQEFSFCYHLNTSQTLLAQENATALQKILRFSLPNMIVTCYIKSMAGRRSKPILVNGPNREDLERVVDALNSKQHPYLEQLVTRYFESGPNLKKMLYADMDLFQKVSWILQWEYLPTSTGQARIAVFPSTNEVFFEPDPDTPGRTRFSDKGDDTFLFAVLTVNPDWKYFGGPCARCRQYYIKKKLSQKVYCSRRCGNAATATARSAEKWHEEHQKKLNQAREIKRTWNKALGVGWKEFVSEKTGFTVKWLTRNEKQLRREV